MVADALSCKSAESLSCLHCARIENFIEMKKMAAGFELTSGEILLARFVVRPFFVDQIQTGQDNDEFLVSKKKLVLEGLGGDFSVSGSGMLLFGNRMCVPDDSELRHCILEEGHSSAYAMHPGENKLYRNLREIF